ncbi:hypothetical protein [Streptomyces sp. NPDC001594]|uniref:hypothetical protein n=1 Tax=Streptomyces sp. NPDC001594 TaxID=3364590 RepID=UPI00367E3218
MTMREDAFVTLAASQRVGQGIRVIFQLYGEWAECSPAPATYEAAARSGCQTFADRRKEYFLSGGRNCERSMANKGLVLYIHVPDALGDEIRPNGATLDHVVRAQREKGVRRAWSDGFITAPEPVLREALEAFWSIKNPDYEIVPAQWREGMRRAKPPSIENLSGLIDYSRCRQSGPVLVVEEDSWRFEDPADRGEELPFLVALSDPHYYCLPLTGPYGSWGVLPEQRKHLAAAHVTPERLAWRW